MTDRTLRISARMAEEIQQWASDELSQWPRDTAYAADLENLLSQLTAAAPAPDPVARLVEAITPAPQPEGEPVTLTYTNWRGETAQRTITPKRIWWGATDWHPEPQWLLTAFDAEKQADRDFALKDFGAAARRTGQGGGDE